MSTIFSILTLLLMRRAVTLLTGILGPKLQLTDGPPSQSQLSFFFSHPFCHWCFHRRCAFSPTIPALLPEAHINSNNVKSHIPLQMCTTSSLSIPLLIDMQVSYCIAQGLPGDSGGKEFACHCRRCGL